MTESMRRNVLPTRRQLEWADCEIGVIIHLDLQVFEPSYVNFRSCWGYTPPPSVFNPASLDTDQWVETAKSAGAKYAVLVAKHCSGFSLWPTKAHDYSVKSSPWRNGEGDVVKDFFKSCAKYGLKPGLYYSASGNAHFNVDTPGLVRDRDPMAQAAYNRIVETQLSELWSQYGDVFEIWFDGSVLLPEQGGPAVIPLLERLQPDSVVLDGPAGWPSLLRTIGNERAEAPVPCWSTSDGVYSDNGGRLLVPRHGSPLDGVWSPGEADMPNRDQHRAFQGGWFWREGDDRFLYPLEHLVERYFTSVGRNTNLLVGMVIDNRGLVPEADRMRFAEFGERIGKILSRRIASTSGDGASLTLRLPDGARLGMVSLMEDVAHGERVRKFRVEASLDGEWLEIWRGTNIGHKQLERFDSLPATELRLSIGESDGEPRIREFAAWELEKKLFSAPLDLAKRSLLASRRDSDGNVSIECDNPYLSIRYTTDGREPDVSSQLYGKPFNLRDGGLVKAAAFINNLSQSETFATRFGCDRSSWRISGVSFDSPFKNGGAAGVEKLLDDDPDTYWHTWHMDKSLSAPPHEVSFDMGRVRRLIAFTLMPCVEGPSCPNAPDEYEFHLSPDGKEWILAAEGSFPDIKERPVMQEIRLESPLCGRYLRFVARRAVDGCDYVKVAGIGAIEA